jgi:SAM-dependent methyltransferase
MFAELPRPYNPMGKISDALRMVPPGVDLQEGHYAKKQLFCRDRLIAWSHRRRFQIGMELAQPFAGRRVLDYGCGDGTFLAMLMDSPAAPAAAVGGEIEVDLVADCRGRLGHLPNLQFLLIDELEQADHAGAYDAIFCMEVLEHVVEIEPILARFDRLLAPSGMILVSVPVETGVPLMVKQVVRRIAGWRGLGDYPGQSPYTFREFWASMFADSRQHIVRPIHQGEAGVRFHDHKGFNWQVLGRCLAQRFELEKTLTSPLSFLPPQLASQVWFLLRKKSAR